MDIREALQTLRDNIRDEKGSVQRLGIRDNDYTREAISVLLNNEAALIANGGEAVPYAYGVIRQDGEIDFSVTVHPDHLPVSGSWASDCCHAHINDAVRAGIEGSGEWVVRPLYTGPVSPSVAVPEGWKLVPVKVTREMCEAAAKQRRCVVSSNLYATIREAILAAPQPDHTEER